MDEHEFQMKADEALEELDAALGAAADEHGFEPDFQAGALSIEFDDPPGKFVISPNSAVRQIWVSALATSYKLDWDAGRGAFIHAETRRTLKELIGDLIAKQIGEPVQL